LTRTISQQPIDNEMVAVTAGEANGLNEKGEGSTRGS